MSRRLLDALFRSLARLALGVFFRRIEIVGRDRLPDSGAALYVGNHYNGLIDPALAIGWLPPGLRMLAKSTLWSHVPAGLLVRLAGAIPVYRRSDAGVDTTRNAEMFERCYEALGRGGSIALFPEGISHNEPSLQQIKTGAARIALGSLARHPDCGLTIVPFGLVFEDRERFRSRVLMEIGDPIRPDAPPTGATGAETTGDADRDAVRDLTDRIDAGLRAVTLNYATWSDAELLRRAADLYFRERATDLGATGGLGSSGMAATLPYRRAFARAYPGVERREPELAAHARREARSYFRLLDLARLDDRQVTGRYSFGGAARFLLSSIVKLVVLLPLGLVGTLVHWLPYRIPGWAADALPIEQDQKATYKLVISLFLFPAVWLTILALVGSRFGGEAALVGAILLPLSGYAALRMKERLELLLTESRAFFVLMAPGSKRRALRQRRDRVLSSIEAIVTRVETIGDLEGSSPPR